MPKPSAVVAVDTNVLVDRAADDELVLDCLDTIRKRLGHTTFVLLPTVIQELAFLADEGHAQHERDLAGDALRNVTRWKFVPVNFIPAGHGVTDRIAARLRARGLLPEEEVNDSLILAEAALAEVTLLVSSDAHIRDIDYTALKIELDACDVSTPLIAAPAKIVKSFFN